MGRTESGHEKLACCHLTEYMRELRPPSPSKAEPAYVEFDVFEQLSNTGASSTTSFDRFCSDLLGEGSVFGSPPETNWESTAGDDTTTTSLESSPLRWPQTKLEWTRLRKLHSMPKILSTKETYAWEETKEKDELHELEMMKERFAKLLLGEDMSGGGKGVCTALAISNAITNLSASVFGELWRLEPLAQQQKLRWRSEMDCLLAVCNYIVEFVSCQKLADGNIVEVMVTKLRSDLQLNLPALRKLDTMLLECLDSFSNAEFWYSDHANAIGERDGAPVHRQEEKWWLPTPCVPSSGLCEDSRKQLQQQRDCIHQILKAALAINGQVLSEMEVPTVYWEALPKNGRSSLGESLYHIMTSEYFSLEDLISSLDSSNEHNILELVNRIEAAIHIWHRKQQMKQTQTFPKEARLNSAKGFLVHSKNSGADHLERREVLIQRAESLLLLLRQRFPGLPQTILDMNKIQYNKDVGQSILESYSRVLEGIAFNILSRIDDVLHVDNLTKRRQPWAIFCRNPSIKISPTAPFSVQHSASINDDSPPTKSSISPKGCNTTFVRPTSPAWTIPNKTLSDYIGWIIKPSEVEAKQDTEIPSKLSLVAGLRKSRSYCGNINSV